MTSGLKNIVFPLLRKVTGSLIAQEITSVQPMAMPTGLLQYMDFVYRGDRPCTTPEEFQFLFYFAERFTAKYPVGSVLTLWKSTFKVVVKSEGFPMTEKNEVVFMTDLDEEQLYRFSECEEFRKFYDEVKDDFRRLKEV